MTGEQPAFSLRHCGRFLLDNVAELHRDAAVRGDGRRSSPEPVRTEPRSALLDEITGKWHVVRTDRDTEIRVLFTDVGLPGGMNGRQLAEEARSRRPGIRVLFTTGYARNAIVHDGRLDPGVELITKPFSQAALSAKMRDIIDSRHTPGRILLVEDEALIQMLATDFLEEAGFTVAAAGSATEAMNKLGLLPCGIDVVVLDLGLPDRPGEALLREIRALHPSLPIVLATGQGAGALRDTFKGERNIAYVAKPYDAKDLIRAIRAVGILGAETP